ncbi:MAG: DUF4358 domain-containing protein [Clostridia bacterium]|nr:DUF4358 domain-containing protein [Clostridia bacterium]
MKKLLILVIAALTLTMLAACGGEKAPAAVVDADTVVRGILTENSLDRGYIFSSASSEEGEYLDEDLISTYYGDGESDPDFTQVENYCVYIDESDSLCLNEVGLFRLKEGADTAKFSSYLKARIDAKIAKSKNYPDIDADTLEKAKVVTDGQYVYYVCIKDKIDGIADALKAAIHGN